MRSCTAGGIPSSVRPSPPPSFTFLSMRLTRARARAGLHLVSLAQVRIHECTDPSSTTALEDATLYVRFARECLETGTSMGGLRSEAGCTVQDELGEMERACEARWRELPR